MLRIFTRRTGLPARLYHAQKGLCFLCGLELLPHDWSRDHIFPRVRYPRMRHNIVLMHKTCNNVTKNDREPTPEEVERVRAIYASIGLTAFIY